MAIKCEVSSFFGFKKQTIIVKPVEIRNEGLMAERDRREALSIATGRQIGLPPNFHVLDYSRYPDLFLRVPKTALYFERDQHGNETATVAHWTIDGSYNLHPIPDAVNEEINFVSNRHLLNSHGTTRHYWWEPDQKP